MKFDIIGLSDSYGSHRFSNNVILNKLSENSTSEENLKFIWWIEKVFLDAKFEKERKSLEKNHWFGVAHVPLLTPKWAMYSQNDLSKLFNSPSWLKARANCKGIICLSKHLSEQYRILFPDIPIFNLKHPMGKSDVQFSYEDFLKEPKVVMVGTWLRNFQKFISIEIPYKKLILNTKYGQSFIRDQYAKYNPSIHSKLKNIENISFLSNEDYDALLSSSLVFLGMHDTSANNAVCESIMNTTPFISLRHPAVVEYVGNDYPLLIDSYTELKDLNTNRVLSAHNYLKQNTHLQKQLSYEKFIMDFKTIYDEL